MPKSGVRFAVPLSLAVTIWFAPSPARAVSETYPDFSSTTGLTLSGNAAVLTTADGPVLRLTPAAKTQRGSVFASVTVDPTTFSTAFAFKISDPGGLSDPSSGRGADGLTFIVQAPSASLGNDGSGLGVGGVKPSVAIEFDTWNNKTPDVADPSSNHIGVDINGDVKSVITAEIGLPMNDGHVWYVWIDYDGTSLFVRLGESPIRPREAQLVYAINVPAILGVAQAHVGLSAATAAAWQNHDILRWTYSNSFVEGGVGPDTSIGVEPDAGTSAGDADAGPGGGASDANDLDGGVDDLVGDVTATVPEDAASSSDASPDETAAMPSDASPDAADVADGGDDGSDGYGHSDARPHTDPPSGVSCSCRTEPGSAPSFVALLLVGTAFTMSRRRTRR